MKSFHVSVQNRRKKLWGFKFRSFIGRSVKWYRGSTKGLKPDSTWCWLPAFCIETRRCYKPLYWLIVHSNHGRVQVHAGTHWLKWPDATQFCIIYIYIYIYKSLDRKQPDRTDKHVDKHTDWTDPMPLYGYPCRLSWRDMARTGTDETGLRKHGHCQRLKPPDVGYPAAWLTRKSRVVSNWILTSCQSHRVTSG